MSGIWIADDLGSDYDPPQMDRGEAYVVAPDDHYPAVKHPIGFMRRTPRIRVKAWTMPIIVASQ
jgi:hypothetical protein